MDYDTKTKYYQELKNLMEKETEIKLSEVKSKIEDKDNKLEEFLHNNLLFSL